MPEGADFGPWIDLAARAIVPVEDPFPLERIAELLTVTLHAEGVSFNWASGDRTGARTWSSVVSQAEQDRFLRSGALWHDPLLAWFERTMRITPQLSSRVPVNLRTRAFQESAAVLRRKGIRDRLCMPIFLGPGMHVAFIVAVDDQPFTDADLRIAARLQPLLAGLLRQAEILRRRADVPGANGLNLTARELSVLCLLADGLTAGAIARRLGIAERTVQKHLENIYRKLGARDRLTAVLRAHRAGLLASDRLAPAGHRGSEDSAPEWLLTQLAPAVSPSPLPSGT